MVNFFSSSFVVPLFVLVAIQFCVEQIAIRKKKNKPKSNEPKISIRKPLQKEA